MAVTSIRFNKKEEELLNYLKGYYNCDSSTIIRRSMIDMYEDIKDKEIIDEFEKEENEGEISFKTYDDILE